MHLSCSTSLLCMHLFTMLQKVILKLITPQIYSNIEMIQDRHRASSLKPMSLSVLSSKGSGTLVACCYGSRTHPTCTCSYDITMISRRLFSGTRGSSSRASVDNICSQVVMSANHDEQTDVCTGWCVFKIKLSCTSFLILLSLCEVILIGVWI